MSEGKLGRFFSGLTIRLGILIVVWTLAFFVYLFIRFTSYVPQTVRIDEIRALCDAVKQEGRHWRIKNPMSDCTELRALMEKQAAEFQGFAFRRRDYVYFIYRAVTDGKTYHGALPAQGSSPEIGSKLEIRVSRINHNHYMY